jgi:hypothetical protein
VQACTQTLHTDICLLPLSFPFPSPLLFCAGLTATVRTWRAMQVQGCTQPLHTDICLLPLSFPFPVQV